MAQRPIIPVPSVAPDRERRRNRLLAGLVVAITAYLRFRHLDAGIPHAIGIDEPQIMERAVAMMKSGDFNPRFFDWPSLTIYLHMIVACFTFLMGAMDGMWRNLDQVGPADMYLNGRALTAAFGTATVWLVYLIGSRWGQAQGLLAAALCAVIPSHVRESHYVLADVPTAFFTTLTLWLALRAHERATLVRFALAGAAVGLAASAKYNGVVALVVPLAVAWFGAGTISERARRSLIIGVAAGAAFLAGTPYAVLDLPAFLNDYARLAAIFARERPGDPGWAIYLRHLELALGWPALALTGLGLAGGLWRMIVGGDRARWAALVLFPPLYFQVMAGSYQIYGRYLMPLLPFASLLAAVTSLAITARLSRTRLRPGVVHLAAAALVGIALARPAYASLTFTAHLGQQSTLDQAWSWIRQNAPRGSRVAIERQALQLPGNIYEVVHVRSLVERTHAEYVTEGVDYLLASSDGYGDAFSGAAAARDAFVAYQTLFTQAEPLATFTPSPTRPGPELRIFKVRP
jgi:4-amino-4-deoxy-L-arabinose transferase-like glycosyltransferase